MSLLCRWRNRATVLALVVGLVLVVRGSARQTTFYIDSANPKCTPGAGPGTQATPYCSMAYAATIANPGDTFLVQGPKHGSAPVTFTRPGTLANPITWRAVGPVALGGFIDINDATMTPSGLANVWQVPWTATTARAYQTFFDDVVVDDPNQSYFVMKESDGPLQLTSVTTEAEVVAHDGTSFRDAANQRLLIHPYGNRTPSPTTTDFVVGVGNSLVVDTKANYQVFDGFTITYTAGTSGTVLSSNNRFLNIRYVGQGLSVYGNNNYFENIDITHNLLRIPPAWSWFTDGGGAGSGFNQGTGHVIKNLHVYHNWNSSFSSEGTDGNIIDGGRFHGAPNHCTGAANGHNIVRNATWYNCQDHQWLFDPGGAGGSTGIVMEHVVMPSGIAMSAVEGNIGPITVRNSIFGGNIEFVRGDGAAEGLPYDGCAWEPGSLIEYNIIQTNAMIERCDTQISYPIDEYIARCASGEFTGCATIRNNIKTSDFTWNTILVSGKWTSTDQDTYNAYPIPGSPAINAGMVSGATTDIIGITRPQPVGGLYDIGIYEFTPGGDPAPTGKPIVAAPASVTTTITAPTSSATYDAGTSATLTTLAGTVKSGRTITGCTWVNSLGGSGSTTTATQTTWTVASIPLTVSTNNVITVTCTNDGKTTGSDIVTVTRSSGGAACSGACFYIDFIAGNDSNNGTSTATPWKRAPGMTGATGVAAAKVPANGDTYVFKGGVTWTASFPWTFAGGASGNHVTYTALDSWYTGGSFTRPIFDALTTSNAVVGMANMANDGWLTLNNLDFRKCDSLGVLSVKKCLVFENAHDITITNSYFSTQSWIGLYFPFSSAGTYSNFIFDNLEGTRVTGLIWMGIAANAVVQNVTYTNSVIHDFAEMLGCSGACGGGGAHGDGFLHFYTTEASGGSSQYMDGFTFCNNRSYGDFTRGIGHDGPGEDMTALIYLEGPIKNGLVCNNDFNWTPKQNPASAAPVNIFEAIIDVRDRNSTQDGTLYVVNNTIRGAFATRSGSAAILASQTVSNIVVKNNAIEFELACLYGENAAPGGAHNYNNRYCPTQALQWTGEGANSISSNNLFVSASDSHLQSGSPNRNAAENLSSLGFAILNADKDGVARGSTWDIGAYEYVAPAPEPSPEPSLVAWVRRWWRGGNN